VSQWLPLDCHAHSTASDGVLSPDAVIAAAAARGVRGTVSDHVSRDVALSLKSPEAVTAYLQQIAHLPSRSAEFCWHDALWRELPDAVLAQFTHRIGSLHALTLGNGALVRMFQRALPNGLSRAAYMDQHIAAAESLLAEMPIDIFAHPTLVPYVLREVPGEELWSVAHEERLVRALLTHNICFELSNRYRVHARLVQRAHAAGVRFSLGSDGHQPAQVGDIEWPLDLARSLGLADTDLYDPAIHGTRRD
jgi:histidinol phosphatase-like PHP family hydrolase